MMKHKNLMQSANCPMEPGGLEVDSVRVTPHQVLRQDHDKPLEYDKEQVLLVSLGGLQLVLQLLHLVLRRPLGWFGLPAASRLVLAVG